jgi:single-strand DNA-binding protein
MVNLCVLQGRLTKDPEIRSTQSGSTVAGFTLAVDRDYQPGGAEKKTDFVDCSAWRNTAGFVERNFRKGQMVVVKGRLESRKWQDKTGANRISWEVVVDDCWFCGDRASERGVDAPPPMEELPDGEGGELPF